MALCRWVPSGADGYLNLINNGKLLLWGNLAASVGVITGWFFGVLALRWLAGAKKDEVALTWLSIFVSWAFWGVLVVIIMPIFVLGSGVGIIAFPALSATFVLGVFTSLWEKRPAKPQNNFRNGSRNKLKEMLRGNTDGDQWLLFLTALAVTLYVGRTGTMLCLLLCSGITLINRFFFEATSSLCHYVFKGKLEFSSLLLTLPPMPFFIAVYIYKVSRLHCLHVCEGERAGEVERSSKSRIRTLHGRDDCCQLHGQVDA